MSGESDTIVAAATPPGTGGIAIVRVSGDAVERIARRVLGSLPQPRTAALATFRNTAGDALDNGVALYFPAPNSFTGESVLELHGHGGQVVVRSIVEAVAAMGARLAEPGEFTQRAFVNNKLDLAQAEAVADLIGSSTSQAARAALRSLSGEFSRTVNAVATDVLQLRMHVEAAIDFPEEEIDFLSDAALQRRLERTEQHFAALLAATESGRLLRDGLRIVIAGRPNAGKSSLLNRLCGDEAAIVTEVAGTTRDLLRERINVDGLAIELVDTAGLRDEPDRIEAEGIRRARDALQSADAVLWIQDATIAPRADEIENAAPADTPRIVANNKIDLTDDPAGPTDAAVATVNVSAKTGDGIEALLATIRSLAGLQDLGEGTFTARRRHVDALQTAWQHFIAGRTALREHQAGELMAEELKLAHASLGSITGTVSSDDLLGHIFSEFCIGK